MKSLIIGKRIYTLKDQKFFADCVGDWNPIHIDSQSSRRSLTGDIIVHGMHVVLDAIESLSKNKLFNNLSLKEINIKFLKPIFLNQELNFFVDLDKKPFIELKILYKNENCLNIRIEKGIKNDTFSKTEEIINPFKYKPDIFDFKNSIDKQFSFEINCKKKLLTKKFNFVSSLLGEQFVITCAQLSQLVGMHCPGLYSLFSSVSFSNNENKKEGSESKKFLYSIINYTDTFKRVKIKFNSFSFSGNVIAFVRPKPLLQPSISEVKKITKRKSFDGRRCLIIGGSRGIGEVTAKILSVYGADVLLTYNKGKKEADSIVKSIKSEGYKSDATFFNIEDTSSIDSILKWEPTHLYYFATPHISSGSKNFFSEDFFNKFSIFYVFKFNELAEKLIENGLKYIFYPSSVFLDELPLDMIEYCAAKSAGEFICNSLQKKYTSISIDKPRLPRMLTDQTSSILPIHIESPLEVMHHLIN